MASTLYAKLDKAKREIRVIELEPGQLGSQVRCRLLTVSLKQSPSYEAFSYVWGPTENNHSIIVNDIPVSVTDNLYSALCRLRRDVAPRLLWIDQLCINQSDISERSQQVDMMRDIYTSSSQALLWIGEEPDEPALDVDEWQLRVYKTRPCVWSLSYDGPQSYSHQGSFVPAFGAADWGLMCASFEDDYIYHAFSLVAKLASWTGENLIFNQQETPHKQTFRTLRYIIQRPWWNRIWTLQECLLPRKAFIMYGPVTAPLEMFFQAALQYPIFADFHPRFVASLDQSQATTMRHFSHSLTDLKYFYDKHHAGNEIELLRVLNLFRVREATDDRDKVYGLLGLNIDWKGQSPLYPDYKLSTVEVYQNTVIKIIEATKSLDVLMSNLDRTGRMAKEQMGLPSIETLPELPSLDGISDLDSLDALNRMKDFMNIVNAPAYAYNTLNQPNLPSWVPDWSGPTNFEVLSRFNQTSLYAATGSTLTQARLASLSPPTLALRGFEVDTIRWSTQIMAHSGGEERSTLFNDWKQFAQDATIYKCLPTAHHPNSSSQYYYGEREPSHGSQPAPTPPEDAFWRTICGDTVMVQSPSEHPLYTRASNLSYELYLKWCVNEESASKSPLDDPPSILDGHSTTRCGVNMPYEHSTLSIEPAIRAATTMRRMFITRKVYMGIGTHLAVGGEKVFLFYGGKAPFLVRPKQVAVFDGEESGQRYELVGDCYIHGIMDGEAMSWGCPETEILLV